jgi:hypothetical protein
MSSARGAGLILLKMICDAPMSALAEHLAQFYGYPYI